MKQIKIKHDSKTSCWVLIFFYDRCVSDVYVFSREEDSDNYLINYINKENDERIEFTTAQDAEDWWDSYGPDGETIEYREVPLSNEKIIEWSQLTHQKRFDL